MNGKGVTKKKRKQFSRESTYEFKILFEPIRYPPEDTEGVDLNIQVSDVTIPILDDAITAEEVQCQLQEMKPNTSCGPDGIGI